MTGEQQNREYRWEIKSKVDPHRSRRVSGSIAATNPMSALEQVVEDGEGLDSAVIMEPTSQLVLAMYLAPSEIPFNTGCFDADGCYNVEGLYIVGEFELRGSAPSNEIRDPGHKKRKGGQRRGEEITSYAPQ